MKISSSFSSEFVHLQVESPVDSSLSGGSLQVSFSMFDGSSSKLSFFSKSPGKSHSDSSSTHALSRT